MKGDTRWNYRPYSRLIEMDVREKPFVCRIVPQETGFTFQWFDNGRDAIAHIVRWRKYRSPGAWQQQDLCADEHAISGLECDQDYEFAVARKDGTGESHLRLVRTGFVPGTIVNYLHPEDTVYSFSGHSLCSPSLVRLPSGDLLTAMDVFSGQFGNSKLTLLFKSKDNGATWRYVTDIYPSFWPKLFVHRKKLYLLSCTQDYGDLVIGRSDDEGESWTKPVHLLSGSGPNEMGPHKAPMPVIEHEGRLYTGIDYGCWRHWQHSNGLASIDADADLLDAANWCFTPFVRFDPAWPGAPVGPCPGCIEGNAVVAPDGKVCNMLRIDLANCTPETGKAVLLQMDSPEEPLRLRKIVACPLGSNSKFKVQRDPVSGMYILIGSEQDEQLGRVRTVLSMAVSPDLERWRIVKRILDCRQADPASVGFQYPDFLLDGDDLLVLVRTAFNHARNFHDANYQTFHRITNFRSLL